MRFLIAFWLIILHLSIGSAICQTPTLTIPSGHADPYRIIEYNHTGTLIATADTKDGTIKVWEVRSGRLFYNLVAHEKKINSIHFSNNDSLLISSSIDGSWCVWEVSSSSLLKRTIMHRVSVIDAQFTNDMKAVLVFSRNDSLSLYRFPELNLVDRVKVNLLEHAFGVNDWANIQYEPKKQIILITGEEVTMVFQIRKDKLLLEYKIDAGKSTIDPTGSFIISAPYNVHTGHLHFTDITTGVLKDDIRAHSGNISGYNYSHDKKQIVTSSADGSAAIIDITTRTVINKLSRHDGLYDETALSLNDSLFVGHNRLSRSLHIWNCANAELLDSVAIEEENIETLSFLNSHLLFVAPVNAPNYIYNLSTGKIAYKLADTLSFGENIVLGTNGKLFAFRNTSHKLVVYDIASGNRIAASSSEISWESFTFFPGDEGLVFKDISGMLIWAYQTDKSVKAPLMTVFHSLKKVATTTDSSRHHFIGIAEVGTNKIEKKIYLGKGYINDTKLLAVSADDQYLAVVNTNNTIRVFEIASGNCIQTYRCNFYITQLSFSKAYSTILFSNDHKVVCWNYKSDQLISKITENYIKGGAYFSSSGRYIRVGHRFYHANTGAQAHFIKSIIPGSSISYAGFANDSVVYTTTRYYPTTFFWNAITGRLIAANKYTHQYDPKYISGSDGMTIAITADNDKSIEIVDGSSFVPICAIKGVNAVIHNLRFNPSNNELLWLNKGDNFARAFNIAGFGNSSVYNFYHPINTLQETPDWSKLLFTTNFGVEQHDARKHKLIDEFVTDSPSGGVFSQVDAQRKRVYLTYYLDSFLYVYNVNNKTNYKIKAFRQFSKGENCQIKITPDGNTFVTTEYVYNDQCVYIRRFDAESGKQQFEKRLNLQWGIKACNISPNGAFLWLVSGSSRLEISRISMSTGELSDSLHLEDWSNYENDQIKHSIEFSQDGRLAFIQTPSFNYVIEADSKLMKEKRYTYDDLYEYRTVEYNKHLGLIAATSVWSQDKVYVIDPKSNRNFFVEKPDYGNYFFAAKGKYLVVQSSDILSIKIFDCTMGKPIAEHHFNEPILTRQLLFDDNGKYFLVNNSSASAIEVYTVGQKDIVFTISYATIGATGIYDLSKVVFFEEDGSGICITGYDDYKTTLHQYSLAGKKHPVVKQNLLRINPSARQYYYFNPATKEIAVHDLFSSRPVATIKTDSVITELRPSTDGRMLLGVSGENLLIWDLNAKKMTCVIRNAYRKYNVVPEITRDNRFVISGRESVIVYSTVSGKELFTLENSAKVGYPNIESAYPYFFCTDPQQKVLKVWSAKSGKLLFTETIDKEIPTGNCVYLENIQRFLVQTSMKKALLIDPANSEKRRRIPLKSDGLLNLKAAFFLGDEIVLTSGSFFPSVFMLHPDGNLHPFVVQASQPGVAQLAATNSEYNRFCVARGHSAVLGNDNKTTAIINDAGPIEGLRFADNGKYLYAFSGTTLSRYDASNGKLLNSFEGSRFLNNQFISEVNNHLLIQQDLTLKIYDCSTGKMTCFLSSYDSGHIVMLSNGYYMVNRFSANKLYYIKGGQAVSFSQWDLTYNRPDIVLQELGKIFSAPDASLVRNLKRLYEKRVAIMAKRGVFVQNTTQARPLIRLLNKTALLAVQLKDTLSLHLACTDTTSLDHLNLWVNGCPISGSNNDKIYVKRSKSLDTSVNIVLNYGANTLEYSVTNTKGVESDRTLFTIHCLQKKPRPEQLYFLGFGVDHYTNAPTLTYSVKDIRDLAQAFSKMGAQIDTLMDEQVTTENVRQAFGKFDSIKENDIVVVAYSGHGAINQQSDYFLGTSEFSLTDPANKGISYAEFEYPLEKLRSRKKILLIDACHSGDLDEEDLKRYKFVADSLRENGVKVNFSEVIKGGGEDFENLFEAMQQAFLDVGGSTGCNIITAATGTQLAQARGGGIENGVFSAAVLQAIKEFKTITINQLKEYVEQQVQQMTDSLQRPSSRNSENYYDWFVW